MMLDPTEFGSQRTILPRNFALCFCSIVCWIFCLASTARADAPTFEQLSQLPADSQEFAKPIELTATIVFIYPQWHVGIVTDGTGSAILEFGSERNKNRFKVGDKVTLSGNIAKAPTRLTIKMLKAEKVGKGILPTAVEAPEILDAKVLANLDLEFVRVNGRLTHISHHYDRVQIRLDAYGHDIYLEGTARAGQPIFSKIGATVSVEGFFFAPYATKMDRPKRNVYMVFRNIGAVTVLSEPETVLDYRTGEIVRMLSDRRAVLLPEGETNLIEIEARASNGWLKKNQLVGLWGNSIRRPQGDVFTVKSFRHLGNSKRQLPLSSNPAVEYVPRSKDQHLQLITIVGDVIGGSEQPFATGTVMLSQSLDESPVQVFLPGPTSLLANAERVEVTGFLDLAGKNPSLYPSGFDQIKVLAEKQWHQAAAFRWAVAGTAITLFSSFLLVASLRAAIRRRTEALDRSLGLLTASYDAIHEGLCVIDRDGTVRNTNPRFRELLGLEESDLTDIERDPLGKQMSECFAEPLEFLGLWSRLGSDSESTEEGDLKLVSGADAELHFYSVPAHTRQNGHHLGRLWVFRDMTEQRHLESSLVQSQKMEAVGRLAGGVAHDFNNLLTGIVGNLSIARLDSSKPIGELDEPLDAAKHAANRAAILIKSLLGFSRQETLESRPSCANAVVQELVTLVRPTFDPKIELESTLEENLSLAGFDPTKLEQVLLNMVVNARDAIGSNGGKIQLTTSGVQIAHPETGAQDRYVCISITDTGSGMADDVRDRVFEPFFTTKDQGKGTGLGLATSYGIIQQMAGWISCESELGEGTTFRIYLSEVEPGTVQEIAEEPDTTRRNYGIAREEIEVLCIDDELVLRRVAEGLLSHSGFQICSAEHGRAALDLLAKRAESGKPLPDIIITDLTMPVMDGKETLQAVRRNYPDLPVVICSGYLVNLDKFAKEAGVRPDGFIQKPYEAGKMIDCIESLMSETLTS